MARTRTVRLLGGALATAALIAAGVGSALAADTTTTDATTTELAATTETVQETQTLQLTQTVQETRTIPVRTATTTSTTSDDSSTPAWAWVLIALGIAGLIALIVWLIRRGDSDDLPLAERQRLVSAAVASWVGQGWAIESQTAESAVLAREGQRVVVSVDALGHVTSGPLGAPPPSA
jgi:hypothetical protein